MTHEDKTLKIRMNKGAWDDDMHVMGYGYKVIGLTFLSHKGGGGLLEGENKSLIEYWGHQRYYFKFFWQIFTTCQQNNNNNNQVWLIKRIFVKWMR
jgi:hypothetical protein